MTLHIPSTNYPIDRERWGSNYELTNEDHQNCTMTTTYVLFNLTQWRRIELNGEPLWDDYRDAFRGWTHDVFGRCQRNLLKELYNYLKENGVWLQRPTGSISFAKTLARVLEEEEQHEWTKADINEYYEKEKGMLLTQSHIRTMQLDAENSRPTDEKPADRPRNNANAVVATPLGSPARIPLLMSRRSSQHANQDAAQHTAQNIPQNGNNQPARTNQQPPQSPQPQPPSQLSQPPTFANRMPMRYKEEADESIALTNHNAPPVPGTNPQRALESLIKIYATNQNKYTGTKEDLLDKRLQVFYRYCKTLGVTEDQYETAFPFMITGRAEEYFYNDIAPKSYDFSTTINMIRDHFETQERRQEYLTQWRKTTLPSVMSKNPDKTQSECLELLFDQLHAAQRVLSEDQQGESRLRDLIVNACEGVPECRPALFRPSDSIEGLRAELRSAVRQCEREKDLKSSSTFWQDHANENDYEQYWTDRTYGGSNNRFGNRSHGTRKFQDRNRNRYRNQHDRATYRATPPGTNFASKEFRLLAKSMAIQVKEVPVEAHNSIGKVERYHAPLRRAYYILLRELEDERTDKEIVLQMAVKAINDTAGPNGIVPTLLVFGTYPRILDDDAPSPPISKRKAAIRTAMAEVRALHAQRQVRDALAMRNGPSTLDTLNLPLQSLVRVWREKSGWQGPYRLLDVDGPDCKVDLPHGPVKFRTTVVKPFYEDDEAPDTQSGDTTAKGLPRGSGKTPMVIVPRRQASDPDHQDQAMLSTNGTVPKEDQYFSYESFLSKREQTDLDLCLQLRAQGKITTPGKPFEKSQEKEISALIARDVFDFVRYNPLAHRGRIFRSRIVNEIKGKTTEAPYEKSRLVIQAYNDEGKKEILTQSPTIQRASQRLIVALTPSLVKKGMSLCLRDVTQAYVQSTTYLNKQILAHLPKEIEGQYPPGTIMIVRKPLYGIPEAGTHWWATYNKHHIDQLSMTTSTYDSCLLITNTKDMFGIVGMQTDDTIYIGNEAFTQLEDRKLTEARILAKDLQTLSTEEQLVFNGCILRMIGQHVELIQKGHGARIKCVDPKSATRQADYREQRARGAYLASICQPEASCDLSIAAQNQEPTDADVKALNKRLSWQIANLDRGLQYVSIDLERMRLFVFVDGSFASHKDMSSQIGYEIILANERPVDKRSFGIVGNMIHWSSTKSKRVTRSVLASEIYGMVGGIDMGIAINTTIRMITDQLSLPPVPIIVCTDSYSLYECLVKLGTTNEKRLMIDIMAIRQSYERRELTEIRWINGEDNPADAMTKTTPNRALQQFIDTNQLTVRMEGWVQRGSEEEEEPN